MSKELHELLKRVETWPPDAQRLAKAFLKAIEQEFATLPVIRQ